MPRIVTVAELARLRGCDRRAVARRLPELAALGLVLPDGKVLADAALAVLGPRRLYARGAAGGGRSPAPAEPAGLPDDYLAARVRRARAQADLAEHELAAEAAKLLDRAEAEAEAARLAEALRMRLHEAVAEVGRAIGMDAEGVGVFGAAIEGAFASFAPDLSGAVTADAVEPTPSPHDDVGQFVGRAEHS